MTTILRSQRGVNTMSLLLGVGMMAALAAFSMKQMQQDGGGVQAINRANDVACKTQRSQLKRDLVVFQFDHPSNPPTIEAMEKSGIEIPVCPEEGYYEIAGADVDCSIHSYEAWDEEEDS